MEDFISVRILLSLPGCITLVTLSTQILKKYITKLESRTIALIVSVVVAIARVIAKEEYTLISIIIGLINTIPILWGATAAYDTMMKKDKIPITNITEVINAEIGTNQIIDIKDNGGEENITNEKEEKGDNIEKKEEEKI